VKNIKIHLQSVVLFVQLRSELLLPPQSLFVSSQGDVNILRTGDADLRFYITTVQDG